MLELSLHKEPDPPLPWRPQVKRVRMIAPRPLCSPLRATSQLSRFRDMVGPAMDTAVDGRNWAPRPARSPRLDLVELWSLGQSVDRLVQDELRRHGASGSLLAVLAAVASGATTTSDVAAVLGQAFMTTSDQLDRLEAEGEIRRVRNPRDGRSKLIRITARGDRRLRRAGPRIRAIERAIAEQLGADLPRVASTVTDLRRAIDVAAGELE